MFEEENDFKSITVSPEEMGFSRGANKGAFVQSPPHIVAIELPDEKKSVNTKDAMLKELKSIMLEQDKSMDYLNAIQRAIDIIEGK